ncbi:restriction endonuclease subunit S [uncultured Anaerococcus sp.]|uniref:restriction endonuclease subunit S n=1 Tax=uncultured Anaerococcus sp. TaxID=293428 RepID=UPI00280634F8|nr:restriction endonuclease subunit S [uncultured Anaerococcus sp.]
MAMKMKDSGIEWIGEIPEDWETTRIGSLYSLRNTKVSDIDYPPLSVTMNGILPQLETAAKTNDHNNRKLVKKDDFVINSRSDRRGSCGISKYDGSVSLINIVLSPNETMNPEYYNWVFTNPSFSDEFYKWGNGIVDDLRTTNWSKMKNIDVPHPNLEVQEKITYYLNNKISSIDYLLIKINDEIEKLENYKKSLITEAVTKGLDKNVEMKDSGIEWIGEIPKHWIKSKVKHACSLIGSGTTPASHNLDFYSDDGINWIQSGDLYKTNEIITTEKNITEMAIKAYPILKIYESPYLVMAMYGASVGNLSISKIDAATNQACCVMKTNNRTNLFYLYYWLLFVKDDFLRKAEGGSQPNISQDKIKNQIMYFPPILEQDAIVNYLNKKTKLIDQTISLKQKQLQSLEEYKKSLIYEYVTGKKEVLNA